MADTTILERFLRRARRRAVAAVLVEQAVTALGAAFAGLLLLLLLGSRILDWRWVLALCLAVFLSGLLRTLRRVPSPYRLAQDVDRRLALEDYIATAHYFSRPEPDGRTSTRFRELVLERAVAMCEEIKAEAAAPIRLPRTAYATLALAVAAAGLFSVRYLTHRSLDFGPPLAPAIAEIFRPSWLAAKNRKETLRGARATPAKQGLAIDPETGEPVDPFKGAGEPAPAGQQNERQAWASDSVLDKLRDAFRDMLDKLGLGDEARDLPESAFSQGQKGGEKGEPLLEEGSGNGTPRPDEEGDLPGPGDSTRMEAQRRPGGSEGQEQSESGDGAGIGSADGEKGIREAEQLAAMGKISELLGKRQANLTGEMMVEVTSSGQQKLTTPYSPANAAHSEGGGEIHRDEVPLAYREYVQQYFEQVRKEAPAARP